MQNGPPNGIKNQRKSQKKADLERTKPTKNMENVLILEPSDLQKTCFRMEGLQQITKTRGADKYEHIPKSSVEMKPKSMKKQPPNSTKNNA